MVNDSKAEEREAKGLYRRATSRWLEVLELCGSENDRKWVASRRARCISLAKRPLQQLEIKQSRDRDSAPHGNSATKRKRIPAVMDTIRRIEKPDFITSLASS